MPKKAIDYSKTILYKIVCLDLEIKDLYIGSTTNFTKRKCGHKNVCQNPNHKGYNYNVYIFIRANGGFQNFEMIEIEKYPCNDENEASSRERYWKEFLNATLNMRTPARTKAEYRIDSADKIKEQNAKYRIDNADKIKEKDAKYRIDNADKLKQVQKKYREENKEKIKEYQKQYRIKQLQKEYYIKQKNKNTTLTVNESSGN